MSKIVKKNTTTDMDLAAELFRQLSEQEQDALIETLRSLLSAR